MQNGKHAKMYQPSNFISKEAQINTWDDLKPYFDILIRFHFFMEKVVFFRR